MHKISTSFAVLGHEISELRMVIERKTGILLDTPDDQLSGLIGEKMEELHLNTPKEFLERLRESNTECENFVEPLLEGTPGFFAVPEAFDALTNVALPELTRLNSSEPGVRSLRFLSAGCATGEEPYSIAISLCEALNGGAGNWNIRIVGTDIRRSALRVAERGLYPESAFGRIPRRLVQSYFAKVGQHFLAKPRLRNLVTFTFMNLVDPGYIGRFHCIFCMNVLSHFSSSHRTALIQRLHLYLEPGGFLFLGEGERLPACEATFQPVKSVSYVIHRKPKAATAAVGR